MRCCDGDNTEEFCDLCIALSKDRHPCLTRFACTSFVMIALDPWKEHAIQEMQSHNPYSLDSLLPLTISLKLSFQ
jgi:hypothetical protein